jgi:hypothetical protein
VRERGLGHRQPDHSSIKPDTVDCDVGIRLIDDRILVTFVLEGMHVDSVFLAMSARPKERLIRPPDLDASRVVRLPNCQPATRRPRLALPLSARIPNDLNGIANANRSIAKVPTAAGTEVAPVRMDAEPVPIKVRELTECASDLPHRVTEH